MILNFVYALTLVFSVAANADPITCPEILLGYIAGSAHEDKALSELPDELQSMREATVLIKFPNTVSMTMAGLGRLFSADVTEITDLRGTHLGSTYTVVSGKRTALEALGKDLPRRFQAADIRFQILDATINGLRISPPQDLLQIASVADTGKDSDIKSRLAHWVKNPFTVLTPQFQTYLFFPKSQLKTIVEMPEDYFGPKGLRLSHEQTPASWTNWLQTSANLKQDGSFVVIGEWVVLTKRAYIYAQNISDRFSGAQGRIAALGDDLLASLRNCVTAACRMSPTAPLADAAPITVAPFVPPPLAEVPAPVIVPKPVDIVPEPAVTSAASPARRIAAPSAAVQMVEKEEIFKILSHLKSKTKQKLYEKGGVRLAFLKLFADDDQSQIAVTYRAKILELELIDYLYTTLHTSPINPTSYQRFISAWQAYLEARDLPTAQQPISANSINESLRLLGEANTPAEPQPEPQPAPERAAAPAPKPTPVQAPVVPVVVPTQPQLPAPASAAPAPVEPTPPAVTTEDKKQWVEQFAQKLSEYSQTLNSSEGVVILNADPTDVYFNDLEKRELLQAQLKSHSPHVDFENCQNVDDVIISLTVNSSIDKMSQAEAIINETLPDNKTRLEKLSALLFGDQKFVVLLNSEYLRSFSAEDQRTVLWTLAKYSKPILLVTQISEQRSAEQLLRAISISTNSIDFNYSQNAKFELPRKGSPGSTNAYELVYDQKAEASVEALRLSNYPRYSQTLRALQALADNPRYPSLESEQVETSVARRFGYEQLIRSVISQGPGGFRILWVYGGQRQQIQIVDIVTHNELRF